MARIRSVHPGFFTDEALVSVTMGARLLFIGLGVEADDKGVFEWKPITLKMRIFPADNVDVSALLAELEAVNAIQNYEIDGRKYGAIRNFRQFQRPKTPNDVHPMPPHFRNYVGLTGIVSPDLPQKGEIHPQMEEGEEEVVVDARERVREAQPPPDSPWDLINATAEVCRAAGIRHVDPGPILQHQRTVKEWLDDGFDVEVDILPAVRAGLAKASDRINSLKYFDRDIRQTRARKDAGHEHSDGCTGPTNPVLAAIVARERESGSGGGDERPVRLHRPAGAGGG